MMQGQPKVTNPGNAASKPVAVNQAPKVTISAPLNGASVLAPSVAPVTVSATDADGTVAKVEFFSNGRSLGTVTQPPFSLVVDWSVETHSVTATATDNQGLSATSEAVVWSIGLPQAPQMAAPVRFADSAQLVWVGGGGPFVLERKADPAEPWGAVPEVVTGRSATVDVRGSSGIFRVVDLAPFNGGSFGTTGSLSGSVILTAEQKAAVLGGRTYVNVHTAMNGGGGAPWADLSGFRARIKAVNPARIGGSRPAGAGPVRFPSRRQ